MPEPIRLGVLTPSSNTALEPLTQAMPALAVAQREVRRPALVARYTADVQQRIVDNDRAIGIDVVAARRPPAAVTGWGGALQWA